MKTEQPILLYMLAVLFIGLKLTHYIDWSWWWILAPLWAYPVATFSAGVVLGLISGFAQRRRLSRSRFGGTGKGTSKLRRPAP